MPGSVNPPESKKRRKGQKSAISIRGLTPGVAVHLGECCHPVPGDRIVGLKHPGHGIDVHSIDCAVLEKEQDREWVDLAWGEGADHAVSRILVIVRNQPGSLAVVTGILAQNNVNIVNLQLRHRDRQFHTFLIDIEVDNLVHLTNILASLRATQAVTSVDRVKA